MEVRRDDPTNPAVAALLAEHVAEQQGNVPAGFAFALDAGGLAVPEVTFWTVWDGDTLAGFGALKQLDAVIGEVKSMRAARPYRGRGVGHAVLQAIVAEARARAYRALFLETGTSDFYRPAHALYARAGFVPCAAFGDYAESPHNRFFTLTLRES
jgi:putative acetyltransferase